MKAQKIRTTIAEIVGILLTIVILAPFLLVVVNSAKVVQVLSSARFLYQKTGDSC